MINILFWNTHMNKEIDEILVNIILENKCDIIVLAEYSNDISQLCNKLSLSNQGFFPFDIGHKRIQIIAKEYYIQDRMCDSSYYTIQNIKSAECEFILTGVHLPSKRYSSAEDNGITVARMIKDIEDAVRQVDHNKYLIVGDLNANPFESICINADKLHAIPYKDIFARKTSRPVQQQQFSMRYNPMWNLFGDFNAPAGTYFYSSNSVENFFWNIFDQVILSPSMVEAFQSSSLRIITNTNSQSLMKRTNIPDKVKASDHFPIFFALEEEKLQ